MREAAFVKLNQDRWQEFEKILESSSNTDPDKLGELFIQITDDLSFAQTQYPDTKTAAYLNSIASQIHQRIYKNKKEDRKRFITFWKYEVPLLMRTHRRNLFYSFLIFIISVVIGAVSVANDDTFVRLILGDSYVNLTLENIEKGDPMAIYKSMGRTDMFLAITFNNIRVSFLVFAAGIIFSVGTGYLLFFNGIMLGAFQYFFYQKGLLLASASTIWIHGTLEISAIIIAGAAGLTMGNGLLFPGTFPRLFAFKKGAREGLKMLMGLIPVFIVAGFLESFITRLTEMPVFFKLLIIMGSMLFIVYYFIIYPEKLSHGSQPEKN